MRAVFSTALLVASAASVLAAPAPAQDIALPRALERTPTFETFGVKGARPANLIKAKNDREAALTYIAAQSGVAIADLEVTDDYTGSNGLRHVYVKRLVAGKPVSNQVANVSVKDGKVYAFGGTIAGSPVPKNSFTGGKALSASAAQTAAEKAFGLVRNDAKPVQRFVETSENVVEPVWAVQVTSPAGSPDLEWLEVDVSIATGNIVNAVSWVAHATYTHVKFATNDPRGNIITSTDPWLERNSPKGWHSDGTNTWTETQGNNAYVYGPGKKLLSGEPGNVYPAVYDFTKPANDPENLKAGVANNFVVTNLMHDLGVAYGFTEAAGNFQKVNLGGEGKANDAVQVSVQDNGGKNNANFATPPDGSKPQMNMYNFDGTPERDGTMENDIVIHEYTHGITNRLTGGPANSGCLRTEESGGMGEGWSDTMYVIASRNKSHTRNDDVVIGAWAFDRPAGIRTFPYSTSMERNKHTFSSLKTQSGVHAKGNVWGTFWNEVTWNLIEAKGLDEDIFNPPALPTAGNQIALKLLFDALSIQPCNPTFIQARNAILEADAVAYAGAHKCLIWKGFAKRGLGVKATDTNRDYKDDFSVPAECNGDTTEPTTTVKPPASTSAPTIPTTTAEPPVTTAKPPVTTVKPTTTAKPTSTKATSTSKPTATSKPTNPPDEPWCPWWNWWC